MEGKNILPQESLQTRRTSFTVKAPQTNHQHFPSIISSIGSIPSNSRLAEESPRYEYIEDWEEDNNKTWTEKSLSAESSMRKKPSQRTTPGTPENNYTFIKGGSIGRSIASSAEGCRGSAVKTPKLRSRTGGLIEPNFLEIFDSIKV